MDGMPWSLSTGTRLKKLVQLQHALQFHWSTWMVSFHGLPITCRPYYSEMDMWMTCEWRVKDVWMDMCWITSLVKISYFQLVRHKCFSLTCFRYPAFRDVILGKNRILMNIYLIGSVIMTMITWLAIPLDCLFPHHLTISFRQIQLHVNIVFRTSRKKSKQMIGYFEFNWIAG